jgi:hypothetical protein
LPAEIDGFPWAAKKSESMCLEVERPQKSLEKKVRSKVKRGSLRGKLCSLATGAVEQLDSKGPVNSQLLQQKELVVSTARKTLSQTRVLAPP